MSGRSVNLTILFLGSLRPPKRLTSTKCTYFRQFLVESVEGETKVSGWTRYHTRDFKGDINDTDVFGVVGIEDPYLILSYWYKIQNSCSQNDNR